MKLHEVYLIAIITLHIILSSLMLALLVANNRIMVRDSLSTARERNNNLSKILDMSSEIRSRQTINEANIAVNHKLVDLLIQHEREGQMTTRPTPTPKPSEVSPLEPSAISPLDPFNGSRSPSPQATLPETKY